MYKLKLKQTLIFLAVTLAITGFAFTVYGKQTGNNPLISADDQLRAEQITQLAQVDTGTVIRLYTSVGNWDKLFKNISIYKQLLNSVKGTEEEKRLFELISQYEPADLYVAYDYFLTNELPLEGIQDALTIRSKGEDWQTILPKFTENKQYKNYQVLSKDDLRRLLGQGYLPEDIIQADNIARAKDLQLAKVLKLKNNSNTWPTIAQSLNYQGKEYKRDFKLTVPGITVAAGGDISDIIKASNKKADEHKKAGEKKLEAEFSLTDQELQKYLSQGYNHNEVRNAIKLAQANGVTPEEVLAKKKDGLSWEAILAAYPKH